MDIFWDGGSSPASQFQVGNRAVGHAGTPFGDEQHFGFGGIDAMRQHCARAEAAAGIEKIDRALLCFGQHAGQFLARFGGMDVEGKLELVRERG